MSSIRPSSIAGILKHFIAILPLNPLLILHEIPLVKYFNFVISRVYCCRVIASQGCHLSCEAVVLLLCTVQCSDIAWTSVLPGCGDGSFEGLTFPRASLGIPGCLSCLRFTTSSPRPTSCRHHSHSFAEPRELTTLDLSSRLFPLVV